MKALKSLILTVCLLGMATPATANDDFDRLRDILGTIGQIKDTVDRFKNRKKGIYTCTAEGRRNRGRDVFGQARQKSKAKDRHYNAQIMKQVCINALNDCIRQFRNERRGYRSCVVVENYVDPYRGRGMTIHRYIGRTLGDIEGHHRGPRGPRGPRRH